MYEDNLVEYLVHNKQEIDARKALMNLNKYKAEQIAVMSLAEVCDNLSKEYSFVCASEGKDDVLLIKKDKVDEFRKMSLWLCR